MVLFCFCTLLDNPELVQFNAGNTDNPNMVRLNLTNAFWWLRFLVKRLSTERFIFQKCHLGESVVPELVPPVHCCSSGKAVMSNSIQMFLFMVVFSSLKYF